MSDERRIRSLRELPQEIAPPHDLWRRIEAGLGAAPREPAAEHRSALGRWAPHRWGGAPLRILAAAAVLAALAVGLGIGHWVLPGAAPIPAGTSARLSPHAPETLPAAYVMDPRYTRDRAALLQSMQAQIAALPPESRAKVIASLQTIQQSILDLQAALGRDPSNALLQELLVNTYQDEMRVLTTVHDAASQGKGI